MFKRTMKVYFISSKFMFVILVPNSIAVMCVAILEESLYFTSRGDSYVTGVRSHLA